MSHDGLILKCVSKEEFEKLMKEIPAGYCGGHYAARTATHKILRVGYYWSTIFCDTLEFVKICQPCQFFAERQQLTAMPLRNVVVDVPFQQWGLDFIGEFKDNSSHKYIRILTAIDYFTKLVEAIPTKKVTDQVVMDFLEEKIITRFSVPAKIVTDNAKPFDSTTLTSLCNKFAFPDQQDAIQSRIDQIIESDENRRKSLDQIGRSHDKMKEAFDKHAQYKVFKPSELVLLWDKRREKLDMHEKWDNLWVDLFRIADNAGINSYYLETPDGESIPLLVNGKLMKEYYPEGT
eukprot:PITA_29220